MNILLLIANGIIALAAAYVVMIAALWIMGRFYRPKPRRYFRIPRDYLK